MEDWNEKRNEDGVRRYIGKRSICQGSGGGFCVRAGSYAGSDIKTAVSEAVTNAIIHGYDGIEGGKVNIRCLIEQDVLHVEVMDKGNGIEDIEKAMEPLFTTKPELNRSGMGFPFMEAFMDDLEVLSVVGEGTTIIMKKKIGCIPWIEDEE